MPRNQGKASRAAEGGKSTVTCRVDEQLLDSLSRNLKALRREISEDDEAATAGDTPSAGEGGAVDSSDLNY